jgi:hypothetical protein
VKEDPWASLRQAEAARASFHEAGHWRGALVSQVFIGMNAWSLGDFTRAERELRGTLVADEEFGPISWLRTFLLTEGAR